MAKIFIGLETHYSLAVSNQTVERLASEAYAITNANQSVSTPEEPLALGNKQPSSAAGQEPLSLKKHQLCGHLLMTL